MALDKHLILASSLAAAGLLGYAAAPRRPLVAALTAAEACPEAPARATDEAKEVLLLKGTVAALEKDLSLQRERLATYEKREAAPARAAAPQAAEVAATGSAAEGERRPVSEALARARERDREAIDAIPPEEFKPW